MLVTATVVLPAYISVEVAEDTPHESILELLLTEAYSRFTCPDVKALVVECSIEDLLD